MSSQSVFEQLLANKQNAETFEVANSNRQAKHFACVEQLPSVIQLAAYSAHLCSTINQYPPPFKQKFSYEH